MTDPATSKANQPKMAGVNEFARVITVYGTPAVLTLLAFLLVLGAFGRGFYTGLRSVSAVLLPIVIGSFLYAFRKEVLQRVAGFSTWVGLLIGAAMGVIVMFGVRGFAGGSALPLPELLVAACFSVLVFSLASTPEDRGLSLYYGTLLGMLSYVVLFGFPMLRTAAG